MDIAPWAINSTTIDWVSENEGYIANAARLKNADFRPLF